jgi:ABC-2 type transport system ATP-binding protein
MNTVLKVDELRKTFRLRLKGRQIKPENRIKTINAVDGISFSVEKGEILAFIGPNGAGKSTTIKLITGILYPDNGAVTLLGMDPYKNRKRISYDIGTVFGQKSQLWFHLPPLDSFRLLGAIYDLTARQTENRIEELTEEFGIKDYLNQPVRKLSLGQRIRCEIAASLIHSPSILFLDEPTIGLDVIAKKMIRDLIKRINASEKVTVFLTSHDAGDVEKLCRRAMVINDGSIVWDGSVKKMKYSLLNKRIIDIKHDGNRNQEWNFPGVKALKKNEYSLKLEVDLAEQSLENILGEILKTGNIQDIAVSPIPMEEIISAIYGGLL